MEGRPPGVRHVLQHSARGRGSIASAADAPERAAIPSQSPGGPCAVTPSRPPHLGSAGGPLQTLHLSGALLAARVRNKACATCRRAQDCADTREERRRTARRRDHGSAHRRPDDYEQQRTAPFIDQRRHSTAVRLHSRRDLRAVSDYACLPKLSHRADTVSDRLMRITERDSGRATSNSPGAHATPPLVNCTGGPIHMFRYEFADVTYYGSAARDVVTCYKES